MRSGINVDLPLSPPLAPCLHPATTVGVPDCSLPDPLLHLPSAFTDLFPPMNSKCQPYTDDL